MRVFVFTAKTPQDGSISKQEASQDRTNSIIKNEDYSKKHNQIQIESLRQSLMVKKIDDPKTARMGSIEDGKISTIGEQSNERTLAQ